MVDQVGETPVAAEVKKARRIKMINGGTYTPVRIRTSSPDTIIKRGQIVTVDKDEDADYLLSVTFTDSQNTEFNYFEEVDEDAVEDSGDARPVKANRVTRNSKSRTKQRTRAQERDEE